LSLLQNSNAISSGGYNLESSLRFRKSGSAYLTYTPTTSSGLTKFTVSFWMKRGKVSDSVANVILSAGDSTSNRSFLFFGSNTDVLRWYSVDGGVYRSDISWNMSFRDPSAWYHIVFVYDESNATTSDKIILYVNGVRQSGTFAQTPTGGHGQWWGNSGKPNYIGRRAESNSDYFDGYLTEFNYIPNQALTPSDFGEYDGTTGVWKPKEYEGTYGTNGFYLPMKETQQATGFNTVLYTGNGGTQSITGVGFSPDLVWIKNRDVNYAPQVFDTVRGATNVVFTDRTNAESTDAQKLQSFDADGFTYGTNVGGNESGSNHVAWCWDAGSSTVSNTDGTITSSVRANPATGFSVVTYTGTGANATVGHGLGSAPDMIIVKNRDNTKAWLVYHSANTAEPETDYLVLNDTVATADNIIAWNDTAPTSSVFSLGTSQSSNESGNGHVAYCFSEVAGFSKFGSYTGNGTSNSITGLGFKPAWIMIKDASSGTRSWSIVDNTRSVNDDREDVLYPNLSAAEGVVTNYDISFDADGFTVGSNAQINASGSNIIYMAFADTRDAQFNFDASGNKNNWTANNINSNASSETTYDIMNDVPTLTDEDTANFPTLNPLIPADSTTGSITNLLDGNLTSATYSASYNTWATTAWALPSTGKYYWEVDIDSGAGNGDWSQLGILKVDQGDYLQPRANGEGRVYAGYYGYKNTNLQSPLGGSAYGATYGANDTIGIAVDMDNGAIYFSKNNTWQNSGVPTSGASKTGAAFTDITDSAQWMPTSYIGSVYGKIYFNFGQRPFKYTPPTGYKKLNTYNLPDSTIKDGSQYMIPVTYTGNGGYQFINPGFTPDLIWIKSRSGGSSHIVGDRIRGIRTYLSTNTTTGDTTNTGVLPIIGTFGFATGNSFLTNESGESYVAWVWSADGTSGSSNTDGTITSTVSANTDSGFSVVTYTGNGTNSTVGHGLGSAPKVLISKNRSSAINWGMYHDSLGATKFMRLNTTDAVATSTAVYPTAPDASVCYVGTGTGVNTSGDDYVFYCFAEVEGFSKFGSYTGNGSADGPFVYTGFRPAFVLIKATNVSGVSWVIHDTSRRTYNYHGEELYPNSSGAAANASTERLDILSNGFKLRTTANSLNGSYNYIYMAFAENPFKQSLAR